MYVYITQSHYVISADTGLDHGSYFFHLVNKKTLYCNHWHIYNSSTVSEYSQHISYEQSTTGVYCVETCSGNYKHAIWPMLAVLFVAEGNHNDMNSFHPRC